MVVVGLHGFQTGVETANELFHAVAAGAARVKAAAVSTVENLHGSGQQGFSMGVLGRTEDAAAAAARNVLSHARLPVENIVKGRGERAVDGTSVEVEALVAQIEVGDVQIVEEVLHLYR